MGIAGDVVVGSGRGDTTGNETHALLWTLEPGPGGAGAAPAFTPVDLHAFLPADYSLSLASGVSEDGQVVGHAFHVPSQQWHAVVWVPEPTQMLPLLLSAAFLARTRRR